MRDVFFRFVFPPLLFVFLAFASAAFAAPVVSGKVAAADKKGEAGVRVGAWPVNSLALAGEPPYRSNPTGDDGRFRLELPADGEYYLVARGGGWFCFYGRNPVRVPQDGLQQVNLGLVREGEASFTEKPGFDQGLIGQVLVEGKPVAGALIYVYLDPSSHFKGMGYGILGPTGENGLFAGELPAGTYYLVVRKRRQPGAVGPLQAGDFVGYWHGNPLRIGDGEVKKVAIPLLEVPEKVDRLQASLFGQNSIEGRVVDQQGQPVAGMRVMLYEDPQMLNRPLFVSQPTDADGRYQLSFPYGGKYYVGARSSIGGQPAPGELVGAYAGTPDYTVTLKDGDHLKNIDITVGEMW